MTEIESIDPLGHDLTQASLIYRNREQISNCFSASLNVVHGQFDMSYVKIQIFEKRLHMKLDPVLHCGKVKVAHYNFSETQ